MSIVTNILDLYKAEGITPLVRRVVGYSKRQVLVPEFAVRDHMKNPEKGNILIWVRNSTLGPDALSLITEIPNQFNDPEIGVAVDSTEEFEDTDPLQANKIGINIKIFKKGGREFIEFLLSSNIIFCTGNRDLINYRRVANDGERIYIRLHHGILTKSYGNVKSRRTKSSKRTLHKQPGGFDAQSVSSDVEKYFRSCAEGKSPGLFYKFGYPRFDRTRKIINGESSPVILDNWSPQDESVILYAPTHKDGVGTDLFPFPDFDIDQFREFLANQNMVFYIRMHPIEERRGDYEEYIDGEKIRYAGQKISSSSIELLNNVDILVTDYSSIYMDYILYDRPIIFINNSSNFFMEDRGLAFDLNQYFPGPKVKNFSEFKSQLIIGESDPDRHKAKRQFVQDVFLPDKENTFLEDIKNEFAEKIDMEKI